MKNNFWWLTLQKYFEVHADKLSKNPYSTKHNFCFYSTQKLLKHHILGPDDHNIYHLYVSEISTKQPFSKAQKQIS